MPAAGRPRDGRRFAFQGPLAPVEVAENPEGLDCVVRGEETKGRFEMKRRVALVITGLLLAATAMAGEPMRWLNVNVQEHGDKTTVKVRVPISLVRSVMSAVKTKDFDAGVVTLDAEDAEVDWAKLLEAIKSAPDGDFVTVEAPDAHVAISKKGGTIHIHVTQKDDEKAHVNVTVPADLIAALSVDEQNRLDLRPILDRLAELPTGNLVTVESSEADVRVWIE